MADLANDDTMDLDSPLDMDVDAMPDAAAAELNTCATKGLDSLEGPGPADAAAFESRADPGIASFAWRMRPDGGVELPAAAAVMDDADDPGEDDVDMLQVDDEEIDDDVTAVGGDIMGVGPTWGTIAGDPTSNLGRLGPELLQQVAGDDDSTAAAAAAAEGGVGEKVSGYTRSDEQPSLVFPSLAAAADAGADGTDRGVVISGGGVGESAATTAAAAAAPGGGSNGASNGGRNVSPGVLGVTGGQLSEGDADVRGIVGQVVHEDADDLPLGFHRAGVAADSAALGPDDTTADDTTAAATAAAVGPDSGEDVVGVQQGPGRVGQLGGVTDIIGNAAAETAAAAAAATADGGEGEDAGNGEGGEGEPAAAAAAVDGDDADVAGEYGPHEVDGLEAGDSDEGGFVPASYVRHRSQGHTGIDPDPRDRPDPDPAGGLRSLLATTPEAAVTVAAIDGTLPPTATAAEAVGAAGTGVGLGTEAGGKQVLEGGMGSAPLTAPTVAAMPTVIGPAAAAAAAGVLESVLGEADGTSSHPVHKDDFGMGGVTMPALTDEATLVTDYTEEPKYAAEVPQQQAGPAERSTDTARKVQAGAGAQPATAAAAAPAGAEESLMGSGVAMGSGKGEMLSVGQGVGPAAAGVGGAGRQKSVGQDARHLDAIFAPPKNVS